METETNTIASSKDFFIKDNNSNNSTKYSEKNIQINQEALKNILINF